MNQKIFNYQIPSKKNIEDFYVSNSNEEVYNYVINDNFLVKYLIIYGPRKSGKTHLGLIWKKNNDAIIYNNDNYNDIILNKKNVFVDDFLKNFNEENLFHIINHCYNNKLKILLSTSIHISNHLFKLKDLSSRLKSFHYLTLHQPNDDLIVNLLVKLLSDKQIIINNPDIISFILNRIDRTYESINNLVEKIDKLSLEKKRELTIPLIKELL